MADSLLFPVDEISTDSNVKPKPVALPRLRRVDRRQVILQPRSLEEVLEEDHQARMLWQVVQRLDVSAFLDSIKARGSAPGRAAADPRVLITLWLYATTMGVGSARKLGRLCRSDDAYRWICGGLTMNHHTLSDFRIDHAAALDGLFAQVIASMVNQNLINVHRISQDGTRVRTMAGLSSFASEEHLKQLLEQARAHVAELKKELDAPASSGLSARRKAAMKRAARERQERLEAALQQIPLIQEVADKPKNRAKSRRKQAGGKKIKASTTDPQARKMRMADGGTRPAYNVQFAVDTSSRAVVGVDVVNVGSDNQQSAPMRQQVSQRTGQTVKQHLADGGFLNLDQISQAHAQAVEMFLPPPRRKDESVPPRRKDTPAIAAWRARMADEQSKPIYHERASTVETVNADVKTHRGLDRIQVRGMEKVRIVSLWVSLAYNLMHYGKQLLN